MKIPKWIPGQGGPDDEEDGSGDEERTRLERARRERLRAQRRLAAKAAGEEPAKEPGEKGAPKREPEKQSALRKGPEEKQKRAKSKPLPKLEPARARKSGSSKPSERDKRGARGKAKSSSSPRVRALKAGGGLATALKQGAKATRESSKGVPSRFGRTVLKALGVVFGIFFDALGFVLNILIAIALFVAGPVRAVLAALARLVRVASALATPIRVLTLVVAGAAVLLALSQFADYRAVSIGTDAYIEVETVAPAPERERAETGSAHAYAMVPIAVISLALLFAAISGRRWQFCRLIAGAGAIAILVSLLIDRPAGLDPGELELAFDGVQAKLLGGFYAQLFAGLLLTASALLLGRELRLAGAGEPVRGEGRRSKRRPLRRSPKAEGARA